MTADPGRFAILVVDDEPEIVRDLTDLLADEGYTLRGVTSGAEALALLEKEHFDLVISDLRMPKPDGMEIIRRVQAQEPDLPVILLTAHADPELAREAIQLGAHDYVTKPWNTFELLLRVRRVKERWDLMAQRSRLQRVVDHLTDAEGESTRLETLVARSKEMAELFELARRVAPSDATVLIRGESGTGKSALAAAIHNLSPRAGQPFVKVNCGAIPENLLESELFGHEKGAFTGAIRQKLGLFEVAEGGTLFLDEVGDVTLPVQIKLLEAIEEKAFHRVGGIERIQCDLRILTATHRNLEQAIKDGDFREDLFYRLNVFPLVLPPLRQRRADIPRLVEHFLNERGMEIGKVETEAMKRIVDYPFPGNVRELENLLERALILAGDTRLGVDHFPSLQGGQSPMDQGLPEIPEGGVSLEELEKRYVLAAMEKTGGNKTHAAALLGLTRRTLYTRLVRYGISG